MGLDVYTGPLTRYYAGSWETIAQRVMREHGLAMTVQRPAGLFGMPGPDAWTRVVRWRHGLQSALGVGLAWDEDEDGPYSTWQVGFDGYHALRYLALKDEFPKLPTPSRLSPTPSQQELEREPLEQRFGEAYSGTPKKGLGRLLGGRPMPPDEQRFPHLQFSTMWIPATFARPWRWEGPTGGDVVVGSVPRLRSELEGLNDRTAGADQGTLEAWRNGGAPDDGNFEGLARLGLAVMLTLVREADERRQPLVLD